MALSLNAQFVGVAPPDAEDPHPEGAGIARALEAALRSRGFAVEPFENWRDSGWAIGCGRDADALEVALAAAGLGAAATPFGSWRYARAGEGGVAPECRGPYSLSVGDYDRHHFELCWALRRQAWGWNR